MRKVLYALMGFLLVFSALKADDFLEEANETAPANLNHPMQDLNAIQGSFFDKNRSKMSNTLNVDYFQGQTYKIRLRYAMATLLFFSKPISDFVLGDKVGFDAKILESNDRILLIKPLQIGVDSNISVIDSEGKIFSFYVFSTTFTSSKHPNLQVFIEDKNYYTNAFIKPQKENQENMAENAPKDAPKNNKPLKEEKEETKTPEEEAIIIGDNTNAMKIVKKDIQKGYKALKSSQRKWYCLWACSKKSKLSLMPKEIFNDKQFTYFKFDKRLALSKFPVIYKVVDGYDNPVNTRIVGDYIIAEDVSTKWTLRLGKDYLCIRFVKKAKDE
ncbi:TrbG/VirB9 family P-type conjugative transfer protein [Helicobacter pylori]|uniref:TrbG/VirB9 family P-type conjugative transfer protein n=1 Tax=Helicobacter pylori TaxID=210 RepID=UPI002711DFA3|nr:TrbG/VirB9 family P-type conjugative transfer protein [Helicobacter pylori]MDO7814335.1 TrbG/VirB9 family P-type conjugative transfer protein [Helicobacter pylori]MDO7819259.1 TrbG/VirB9 family P-type conjugative transfer protein [Helicobacter pylori]MDO7827838.1 TrbG/VirB9 family P-type conjugative transfer protein [Helicobacter pylori]MDO7865412.1 TrbG/VirB9 family P-type conjugative transfer protein [Helicobacter pylori]WQU17592.1 TrbG/VirB9 family P-type conjugative transfer protein [He